MLEKQQLASQLSTLLVEIGKVNLWLVYRGVKPMASIVLTFDWKTDQNRQVDLSEWLENANIKYIVSQKFPNTLHISKDIKILETNKKLELFDDFESHLQRGLFYGFPKQAVEAYAKEIIKDKPFPSEIIVFPSLVDEIRSQYWYPYTEYLVRRGFELEDSLVAKGWADLAREEIPLIAKEFEKDTIEGMEELRLRLLNTNTYQ